MLQTTYTGLQHILNTALRYHSKTFNIITDWDGGSAYTLTVSDARTGKVIEVQEQRYTDEYRVQPHFNRLKTKYIFDYDNVLSASKRQDAGAYHFSKSALFKAKIDR